MLCVVHVLCYLTLKRGLQYRADFDNRAGFLHEDVVYGYVLVLFFGGVFLLVCLSNIIDGRERKFNLFIALLIIAQALAVAVFGR